MFARLMEANDLDIGLKDSLARHLAARIDQMQKCGRGTSR
jgi:hypothetical protein